MNKIEYLKKLNELESTLEQAVSISHELFGSVPESEFTEKLYKIMHEVKDILEEEE